MVLINMIDCEFKDGITPSGGVRSEVYYFDINGQSVDKDQATVGIIREFDAEGNLIQETRANLK